MNPLGRRKRTRRGSYELLALDPAQDEFDSAFLAQTRLLHDHPSQTGDAIMALLGPIKAISDLFRLNKDGFLKPNASWRHRIALSLYEIVAVRAGVERLLLKDEDNSSSAERSTVLPALVRGCETFAQCIFSIDKEIHPNHPELAVDLAKQLLEIKRARESLLRIAGSHSFKDICDTLNKESDAFLSHYKTDALGSELVKACQAICLALNAPTAEASIDNRRTTNKLTVAVQGVMQAINVLSQALMYSRDTSLPAGARDNVQSALRSLVQRARDLLNVVREATTELADERMQLAQAIDAAERQANLLSGVPVQINAAGAAIVFSVGKRSARCRRVLAAGGLLAITARNYYCQAE